jgi:hypothetical protein
VNPRLTIRGDIHNQKTTPRLGELVTLRLGESLTLQLAEISFKHSKADSPSRGVVFHEYLREFEAKIRTAGKIV